MKIRGKHILIFLISALATFLFACNTSTTLSTTTTPPLSTTADPIDAILDDAAEIESIYNILISKDGELIKERYYDGYQTQTSHNNVYSVTKSVTSLLLGIAIDKGYIDSVDQSIGDFIDLSSYDNSEELAEIKIWHLLTMSAGLNWDSGNLSGEITRLRTANDPLMLILGRDIDFTPGTSFNYSDGEAHLVSIIITEATGMSTLDFANTYLFGPLGIEIALWGTDRMDYEIGGCDLYLSGRDMIKIGLLVLNGGMYDDTQIVSSGWIELSTADHTSIFSSADYGYFWWLSEIAGHTLISARGWGGQQIYIVPDYDLVITTSANGWLSDSDAASQFSSLQYIVTSRLIPCFVE